MNPRASSCLCDAPLPGLLSTHGIKRYNTLGPVYFYDILHWSAPTESRESTSSSYRTCSASLAAFEGIPALYPSLSLGFSIHVA